MGNPCRQADEPGVPDAPAWRRPGPRGRRPHVLLALLVFGIEVVGSRWTQHHQVVVRPLDHWGYLLLGLGAGLLVVRRRYPLPALAVTLAAALAYLVLDYPFGPVLLAPLVAVFGSFQIGRRTTVGLMAAATYVAYLLFGRLVPAIGGVPTRVPRLADAVALAVWLLVVIALAEANRVRSAHFAEIARTRAEAVRAREQAARARAEQNRRQAMQERLRMAQELHDVLGHHLSLISVQAGVGLHLMDEHPEQARTALQAIKQASAEALREVRSVLGILRAEDEQVPRTPAPSLANLDALLEGANATAVVDGTPRPLPAELDRAAYRVVQEALTNVRRHAGADARATVTIGYGAGELTVRIDDDGSGAGVEAGTGNGIPGMRARVAALGGTLLAGPGPDGGFRVLARMPMVENS